MAKALDVVTQAQITSKRIAASLKLEINGLDHTAFLSGFSISFDKQFGSASASITLLNNNDIFGEGGVNQINVGSVVSLSQYYEGSAVEWKTFYGQVDSRSSSESATNRTITLTCLDYISVLKNWDIDLKLEATKYEIKNETLTPNYLPSPNTMFSQVFNFANENIAQLPPPVLTVRTKATMNDNAEDTSYSGFEFNYASGQVTLGTPFNALENYDLVAKSYYYYPSGMYIEDVLEEIFTIENGYGRYLFDELNASDVITKHLTTTYLAEEGTIGDTLVPNAAASTITIRHAVAVAVAAGATSVVLDSVEGLPNSGEGSLNGDVFTWSGISGTTLMGIPTIGAYALSAHDTNALMTYTATYEAARVWYLKYSNLVTALVPGNFTVPSSFAVDYVDLRYGRIILNAAAPVLSDITCNVDYSFKTLQASGIEINYISLMSKEQENAMDAISSVRNYCAPNYLIRTQGDDKIWSGYLSQKSVADYELKAVKQIETAEDSDLYTHTVFYGKNKNPQNILYGDGISFVTTGSSYDAEATQTELIYDSTADGWHTFKTYLGAAGRIKSDTYTPILYINGVPIDNKLHVINRASVVIKTTTTTETSSGGGMCYITTATCDYLGKEDDCYELETLREFRDMWLKKEPDGGDLIRQYYLTAPKIVEKINAHPDKNRIYDIMWKEYIVKCVKLIEAQEFTKTKELYIKGVMLLADPDKFLSVHKEN